MGEILYFCKINWNNALRYIDNMTETTAIMKTVMQHLINRCGYESVVNYDCSMLWLSFCFGGMMIELECDEDIAEKYSFRNVGDLNIDEFCDDVKIKRLFITDPVSYIDDIYANQDMGWKMFQMVRFIKYRYPESVIDYYVKDFLMDPYIIEGENLWCSYFIEIADGYREDKHFISAVIDHLEHVKPVASVYDWKLEEQELKPRYNLRIITTSTKARRLGYFKLMLGLFKDNPIILEKPYLKKVSETAIQHEGALSIYKNTKGIIKQTKSGGGAKPYVEVALGMSLINKVSNGYELGKVSRAYNAFQQESSNPFEMSMLDKAFYIEAILRHDYLYIYTLLEYAYITHSPSYKDMKEAYHQLLQKNLRQMKEGANRADSIKKYNFQTVEKRIKEWKKPEIYLEHVLMPRLNWLYDLNLLYLHENLTFELTLEGERLFSAICDWRDNNGIPFVDPAPILDAYYMKLFDIVYDGVNDGKLDETAEDQYLTRYLEESFTLFKTFAPNRVTFSVFANYAKWKMYEETACAIDVNDIMKGFLKRNSDKYIFKFQKFYNDGYIQRIK